MLAKTKKISHFLNQTTHNHDFRKKIPPTCCRIGETQIKKNIPMNYEAESNNGDEEKP